jgi:hypothetical protein
VNSGDGLILTEKIMTTDVTFEELEQAIRDLPPSRREEILLFIQFLEYRDQAEDKHLWRAVELHRRPLMTYRIHLLHLLLSPFPLLIAPSSFVVQPRL